MQWRIERIRIYWDLINTGADYYAKHMLDQQKIDVAITLNTFRFK